MRREHASIVGMIAVLVAVSMKAVASPPATPTGACISDLAPFGHKNSSMLVVFSRWRNVYSETHSTQKIQGSFGGVGMGGAFYLKDRPSFYVASFPYIRSVSAILPRDCYRIPPARSIDLPDLPYSGDRTRFAVARGRNRRHLPGTDPRLGRPTNSARQSAFVPFFPCDHAAPSNSTGRGQPDLCELSLFHNQ